MRCWRQWRGTKNGPEKKKFRIQYDAECLNLAFLGLVEALIGSAPGLVLDLIDEELVSPTRQHNAIKLKRREIIF